MSKPIVIAASGPRNPIAEALRNRRAGSGGGGSHRHKCASRGGQRNIQADYRDEYFAEMEDISVEEDGQLSALRRPLTTMVKGGLFLLCSSKIIFVSLCTPLLTFPSCFVTVFHSVSATRVVNVP